MLYLHDEVSVGRAALPGLLAGVRVEAPVHPGFANTDRPEWIGTVRDVADTYLSRVRELGQRGPVVLVGSSIGGWIATEIALLAFDCVDALALISPLGLREAGHRPADHWFMTDDDRASTLFADPSKQPIVEPDEFIANESMLARLGWSPRLADPKLAHRLDRLRMPTLVIWGSDDQLLPAGLRDGWSAKVPSAQVIELDGCGHYPVYEEPQRVAELVNEFIQGHVVRADKVQEIR